MSAKNYFEDEKVGRKNSIIWDHKYSHSIRVDMNHTNPNQPIPYHSKKLDESMTQPIFMQQKNMLSQMVHLVHTPSTVPASPIFTYGEASHPLSPTHDSPAESVTPTRNPEPRNNPPNQLPNVPSDPDSNPDSSDSFVELI